MLQFIFFTLFMLNMCMYTFCTYIIDVLYDIFAYNDENII